jgi:peptidyl-prolyl cis-trans isomerase D
MLGLIVLLIIPSFVFFGIDGYQRMNDGANATVAEVAGQKITQAEWDLAHRRSVESMRQRMPDVDAALLDTPQFKREALDQLVRERVLLVAADDQHLVPVVGRLPDLVRHSAYFAPLRGPDGSVDRNRAMQAGFGDPAMEQQIALRYGIEQVLSGVGSSPRPTCASTTTRTPAATPQAEERRARHILVKADKERLRPNASKAKAKAEKLLAEVRKPCRPALRRWREARSDDPARPSRAATSTSSVAARWSSPSRTPCSR